MSTVILVNKLRTHTPDGYQWLTFQLGFLPTLQQPSEHMARRFPVLRCLKDSRKTCYRVVVHVFRVVQFVHNLEMHLSSRQVRDHVVQGGNMCTAAGR